MKKTGGLKVAFGSVFWILARICESSVLFLFSLFTVRTGRRGAQKPAGFCAASTPRIAEVEFCVSVPSLLEQELPHSFQIVRIDQVHVCLQKHAPESREVRRTPESYTTPLGVRLVH